MDTTPLVLIWPPAAGEVAGCVASLGWRSQRLGEALDAGDAILLVDARVDGDGAVEALGRGGEVSPRVVLVDRVDTGQQDRLIAAGATQIAVLGRGGDGLVQALRLAAAAGSSARDRRVPMPATPSSLERWIDERLARSEAVTAIHVAMVRLDLVNAAHGRAAGTALVAAAERRVAAQVLAVAEEDGIVARVGSSGIAAVIARAPEEAVVAAARIEEALARPFRIDDRHAALGTRLTLAGARPGDTARALLARAAPSSGEPSGAYDDDPLAVDVHLALARGEVATVYQPQASFDGDGIVGVEALARWEHPDRGTLGAEVLLAAAGQAGLDGALSDHIQRRVLAEVAAWPDVLADLRVAINLTAADLARPGIVDTLLAHVDASGVARDRLTIEVTETDLMIDLDAAAAALRAFQGAGCCTAIDDFGTGYSSLAYLATLPIDYLKLDRSLTRKAAEARRGGVVVRAAIDMARSLGIAVVAEGVETPEQRAILADAGCAVYQGYLLSMPLDGGELAAMMEDR